MDVTHLEGQLWIGAFEPDALLRFKHVVMCAPLRENEKEDPRLTSSRMDHCPFTDDVQAPSGRELDTIFRAGQLVARRMEDNREPAQHCGPVLVACREGKNRSGVVAALALSNAYGWPGELALHFVQWKRPGALYNWHFQQLLKEVRGKPPAPDLQKEQRLRTAKHLRDIDTTGFTRGTLVYVKSTEQYFMWDPKSLLVEDGLLILASWHAPVGRFLLDPRPWQQEPWEAYLIAEDL